MSFNLEIEFTGLRMTEKMNDLEKSIFQYSIPRDMDGVFNLALQEGQRLAPFKSGALRGSGRVVKPGPLERRLEFTVDYAMATNKKGRNAGWFDTAADLIRRTLPENINRSVREQTGIVFRK